MSLFGASWSTLIIYFMFDRNENEVECNRREDGKGRLLFEEETKEEHIGKKYVYCEPKSPVTKVSVGSRKRTCIGRGGKHATSELEDLAESLAKIVRPFLFLAHFLIFFYSAG